MNPGPPPKKYELFDHTADIGIRVFGRSPADLFQNAGYALFDLITNVRCVQCRAEQDFCLERDSREELLVEWLGALLYAFDAGDMLFSRFRVGELNDHRLTARAEGEPFDGSRHEIRTGVKAVTYHNLAIEKQGGVWTATVVLDT